jgi:NUMOD3 motif
MTWGFVYGLYHPLTGELRYIGQTIQPLSRRLACHTAMARFSKRRHVAAWIRDLLQDGLKPVIRELCRAASERELSQLEILLIAKAKADGARLTNHSTGGESGRRGVPSPRKGVTLSAETRARIAASKRGQPSHMKGKSHSLGTREKISASKRGVPAKLRRPDVSTEAIIMALQKGLSIGQVSILFGVNRHTVRKRLTAFGGVVGLPSRKVATSVVLQKLKEGSSKQDVARTLGVSVDFVYKRLKAAGRTFPEKRGPKVLQEDTWPASTLTRLG